jgi:hypothetical protein
VGLAWAVGGSGCPLGPLGAGHIQQIEQPVLGSLLGPLAYIYAMYKWWRISTLGKTPAIPLGFCKSAG